MRAGGCPVTNGVQTDRKVDVGTAGRDQINLCRVETDRQKTGQIHLSLIATDKAIWLCGSTPRAGCGGATLY